MRTLAGKNKTSICKDCKKPCTRYKTRCAECYAIIRGDDITEEALNAIIAEQLPTMPAYKAGRKRDPIMDGEPRQPRVTVPVSIVRTPPRHAGRQPADSNY